MIQLCNLKKHYGDVAALKGIDLVFEEGEFVVLKGVSGSGKSTILSLIAGLLKPSEGEVIVDTQHISKLPDHFCSDFRRDNIGFIFQKYNLIPTLSVKENIVLPLYPKNLDPKSVDRMFEEVVKKFRIQHKQESLVKNLSGGEQQRVAIARANINNPKIILADEPTANLDEKLSLDFIEIMKNLKSAKKTIVIATHDPLFFSLSCVDRIIEVKDGKCY